MKKNIHPTYFKDATQKCACGAIFNIGSTTKNINIEICSQCHPFYTGKEKIIDTTGRVEKFKQRMTKKENIAKTNKGKKTKPKSKNKK